MSNDQEEPSAILNASATSQVLAPHGTSIRLPSTSTSFLILQHLEIVGIPRAAFMDSRTQIFARFGFEPYISSKILADKAQPTRSDDLICLSKSSGAWSKKRS